MEEKEKLDVSEKEPTKQRIDYEKLFDRQLRSYNFVLIGFSVVIALITASVIVGGILIYKDRQAMREEIKNEAAKSIEEARENFDKNAEEMLDEFNLRKAKFAEWIEKLKKEMELSFKQAKAKVSVAEKEFNKKTEEIIESMEKELASISKFAPAELTQPGGVETNKEKEARDLLRKGNKFLNDGNPDAAIACYTNAIDKNPSYAMAFYNRGNAYYNKEDYDTAIQDYTKAIELDPNDAMSMYSMGLAYVKKWDNKKVRLWWDKALEKKEYLPSEIVITLKTIKKLSIPWK